MKAVEYRMITQSGAEFLMVAHVDDQRVYLQYRHKNTVLGPAGLFLDAFVAKDELQVAWSILRYPIEEMDAGAFHALIEKRIRTIASVVRVYDAEEFSEHMRLATAEEMVAADIRGEA